MTSGSFDHNGGVLTSIDGDMKITIPEGAIKDGDSVILYIAMGLYGPFVLSCTHHQTALASPYITGLELLAMAMDYIIFKKQFKLYLNILQ